MKLLFRLAPWLQGRKPQGGRATGRWGSVAGSKEAPIYPHALRTHPHTPPRLRGSSLRVVPTQITPHPHPHSRSGTLYLVCPWASSPAPPAGSHLTVHFPPPLGNKQGWGAGIRENTQGCQRSPAQPAGSQEKLVYNPGTHSQENLNPEGALELQFPLFQLKAGVLERISHFGQELA